jgi:hypothetical protein
MGACWKYLETFALIFSIVLGISILAVKAVTMQAAAIIQATGIISPRSTPTGIDWLHTSGENLYDSSGRQFKIHACCINYAEGEHITLNDIQKIKNWGFNTVRTHIYWGRLQPGQCAVNALAFTSTADDGNTAPAGIGLDSIVDWCAQNEMYVILNPHWSPINVAPSWASALTSNYGQITGDGGAPINLLGNSEIQTGVNYFYNWMAQHYATNGNVIFESFNELVTPSASDGGAPFANFNNGWISAIESGEGGNSHLKIVETLLAQPWTDIFTPPYVAGTHNNVLLASHDYAPMQSWHPSSDISYVQSKLAMYANNVHGAGFPWIDTEFSKSQDQANFQSFFTTTLDSFESNNAAGWAYWCYCSDANVGASGSATWNINNAAIANQIMPILQSYMTLP